MRLDTSVDGDGPLVVLLHGMGNSSATWSVVIKNMEASYRLATADLLGHGGSPSPIDPGAYGRERCLEDIDEMVANYRTDQELPVLVGHSFGGYLAMAYALSRPGSVRALVLIGAGPGFENPVSMVEWNTQTLAGATRFGISEAACNLGVIPDSLVFEQLEHLNMPTLIIVGENDLSFRGAATVLDTRIPNTELMIVADAQHNILNAHSAMIGSKIQSFLGAL